MSGKAIRLGAVLGAMVASAVLCCVRIAGVRRAAVQDVSAQVVEDTVLSVRRARIVVAGDLMQHLPQVQAARRDSGFDYTECFRYLKPIFDSADLVVLNLETTLTRRGRHTGYPLFRSPAELGATLRHIGVDVAVLANNHICDNGAYGIATTVGVLSEAGVAYTGAFADSADYRSRTPLMLRAGELSVALLNYTYGTNGMPVPAGCTVSLIDTAAIDRDLRRIDRSQTDCVMLFLHWGDEYARRPNAEQRRLADFCRRRGVELIVGSHPHVVQPIEIRFDTLRGRAAGATFYSLGNLVSNQRNRFCDGGVVATLELERTAGEPVSVEVSYTPVWVSLPGYRILPAGAGDTAAMSPAARAACRRFLSDTRSLLAGDTLLRERLYRFD